jgi:class 3 adenylate cyclase/CHASE2 domain-containing sensor protein
MFPIMKLKHPKKVKRILAGLFAGIFLTLLILIIPDTIATRAEYIFYDAFSTQAALKTTDRAEDIVIVDIDENSLSKYGPYNEWTRDIHASVVQRLEDGGAAAIAFDILFKNADFGTRHADRAEKMLQKLYPEKNWVPDYGKIRNAYDSDSVLVRTVAKNPNVIVCGSFNSRTDYKHQSQWMPLSTSLRAEEVDARPTFSLSQASSAESVESKDLLDNIFPELSHAAKNFGIVNANPDPDGVLRKMRMVFRFPNKDIWPEASQHIYPTLSLVTLMHLFGTDPDSVKIEMGKFINLGKPFGIYRDTLGVLRTTYPQFSYPMIREIWRHRETLSRTSAHDSLTGNFLELTPQIRIFKDSAGRVTLSTDEGDLDTTDSELTDFDRQILSHFRLDIERLENGSSMWLSAELDFHFNERKKRWIPNYTILSQDVLEDLLAFDTSAVERLRPGEEIRFGKEKQIPIDKEGSFLLKFKSPYNIPAEERTFQHISYYDVAEGRIDPAMYQGKIFILGSAAPAMFDFYAAPHDDHFPAVLVHATILQNVLTDDHIRTSFPNPIIYSVTAVCAILIGLFASQYFAILFLLLLFLANIVLSYIFFENGLYIGCTTYLIESVLAFLGSFFVRFYFENRDKTFLDKSFKQYISDKLIDQMLTSEKEPELGGEKKYLTAFFTDVQNFSAMSEEIGDPKRLVDLLNDYLTAMTNILKDENQGTLDKYEGDAIIAFFGAPTPIEQQRKKALQSALAMQKAQKVLRTNWKLGKNHRGENSFDASAYPEAVYRMHTRIGINSGEIVVGNMGSESRKNYTIMGDAVNLASRLESIGKLYGTYILVSEETLAGTHDPLDRTDYRNLFITREIDRLKVVGKTEPVKIYELLGEASDASAGSLNLLVSLWKKARTFYLEMNWEKAIEVFRETALLEPHTQAKDPGARPTPSEVFIKRCTEYILHPPVPPGERWDGIYKATSK